MGLGTTAGSKKQKAGSGWAAMVGSISVLLFIALIIVLAITGADGTYEPSYLLPTLNAIFLSIIPFIVSFLCWKAYMAEGPVSIMLIGCGMVAFGASSLAAGFAIDFPGGQNLTPTIHNTGALLASLFVAAAGLLSPIQRSQHKKPERGGLYVGLSYAAVIIVTLLFSFAAFRGLTTPFFIQGSGPTLLRQEILGTATALFCISSIIFFSSYRRWAGFTYWFGLSLAMISIGLIAIFLQKSVGGPLGWTGRAAQYVGCLYMLFGILAAARSANLSGVSLPVEVARSLEYFPQNYAALPMAGLAKLIERHRDIFENSAAGIIIIDENGRYLMANRQAAAHYQKTPEEIIGRSMYDFLPGETADTYLEFNRQLLRTGGHREYEDTFILPTGERSFLIVDSCLKDDAGRFFAIQSSSIDITKRKKAEIALRESEQRYRLLADNTVDGIWLLDMDLKLKYCSPSSEKQSGFTLQEIMEMSLEQYFTPESLKVVAEAFGEEMPKVQSDPDYNPLLTLDLQFYKKDGTAFWAESNFSIIRDESGKPVSILAVARDISKRKLAEDNLQQSEEKYRLLVGNINDVLYTLDTQGNITFVSSTVERLTKYMVSDLIGKNFSSLVCPDDLPDFLESFHRLKSGRLEPWEFRILDKDGKIIFVQTSSRPLYIGGQISGITGLITDITDDKRAKELLQSEKTMLARTEGIAHLGSWEWDIPTDTVTWSKELFRIFQRDLQDGAPSFAEHPSFYHPDDMARLQQAVEIAVTNGTPYELELRAIRKDGETRVCMARGAAEMVLGRPVRLFGSLQDITERKQADQNLVLNEARYREMFDRMSSCVAVYEAAENGQDFVLKDVNQSTEILEKIRKEDIIGKSIKEVYPGVADSGLLDVFREVWSTGAPVYNPVSLYRDSRTTAWRERYVYKLPSGEIVAIYNDVTELKQTELALRESEGKYRSLVETAGAGVATIDAQGNFTFINKTLLEMTGYAAEDLLGKPFLSFVHPADRQQMQDLFLAALAAPGAKPDLEYRAIRKDGDSMWLYSSPTALIVAGAPIGFTAIVVDITGRKRAETELLVSRDQLRNLAGRLQAGREDERNNIAREIHDDLGQSLTALQIDLSWLIKRIPGGQENLRGKAESMLKLVADTDRRMREIAIGLRPPLLDDLGFASAAKSYIDEYEEKTGIKCEFTYELAEIVLDANVSLTLFRVLQGSLINTAKHARATRAKISVMEQEGTLYLEISDNGRGVSEKELASSKSIGIMGMKERMSFIGGSLQIQGTPGKGTTVKAKIQLQREMFQ
jgi:PAS domain S-box-containing protein